MKTVRTNSSLTSDGNKMNKPSLLFLLLLDFFLSVRCVCSMQLCLLSWTIGLWKTKGTLWRVDDGFNKQLRKIQKGLAYTWKLVTPAFPDQNNHVWMCARLTEKSIQYLDC
ncbi:uncharacterized protein LOC108949528 [Ciona intestinalis]